MGQKHSKDEHDSTVKASDVPKTVPSVAEYDGSEQDCKRLREFFRDKLGFVFYECLDLTKEHLLKELEIVKNQLDKQYFCFICVIMGHGNKTGIATVDHPIHPREIRKIFDNTSMDKFAGKPKLYLINACRVETSAQSKENQDSSTVMLPEDLSLVSLEDGDVATFYSTVSGKVSERNTTTGSTFIQTCVNVFEQQYQKKHISDMATEIISKLQTTTIQVAKWSSSLKREFFFSK